MIYNNIWELLIDWTKKKNSKGVLKEQYVTVGFKQNDEDVRLKLRRIRFKDETGKIYVFITNNFNLPASQIATI